MTANACETESCWPMPLRVSAQARTTFLLVRCLAAAPRAPRPCAPANVHTRRTAPVNASVILENIFQGKLHDTRIQSRRDLPEQRAVQTGVRVPRTHEIQHVESFRPEFQPL